ncbi:MAG: peptide ABC transporter substrate-binding protein [Longilinea sp.]|nr:peptide ABC transporter substrate-binding protein [Longilinea sp.]
MSNRMRIFCCITLFALLLGSCQRITPTAEATRAAPTASATASVTASPQPSPTATATATATATPRPTAIPEGFLNQYEMGISLVAPGWKLLGEDRVSFALENPINGLTLIVFSEVSDSQPTLEDGFTVFDEALGVKGVAQGPMTTVPLQNANGYGKVLQFDGGSKKMDAWIIVSLQAKRTYIIAILGKPGSFNGSQKSLERLLSTVRLFPPMRYDLDRDQTLVQLGGDPEASDLDPALNTSSASDYIGLIYNGLVRLTASMQVVPELAESWQVSPDGLTYTFTLRQGVRFSSGKPITAQDVKDSWERTCDPALQSPTARTYLGDIVGVKDKLDGKATQISGLKVMDERTLQITLDGPKPYFIAKLTYPTAFVMDVSSVKANSNWAYKPNSSGPYTIQTYTPEEGIVFERNEKYFQPPAIRYLVFDFNPGGSPLSLYEEGAIDILSIGSEQAKQIEQQDHPLHAELRSNVMMCTTMFKFNNQRAPMDDIKVRQAFALALDRPALDQQFFDNLVVPANGILPPAMPGYNSELTFPAYDPEAARAALAASRYGSNLPPIVLSVSGYPGRASDMMNAVIDQWQKTLNVSITIEYIDPATFSEEVRKSPGHIVSYGWCADYPDPENFLDLLFHSQSEFNVSGYSNAEVDALLEHARTELSPEKRLALYQQAEQLLVEDFALVPLRHSLKHELVSRRVTGYTPSPMGTSYIFDISLTPIVQP